MFLDRAQRLKEFSTLLDQLQRAATHHGAAKAKDAVRLAAAEAHVEAFDAAWAWIKELALGRVPWGGGALTVKGCMGALRTYAYDHGRCRDCDQHHGPCPHYEDALKVKHAALRLVETALEQEDRRYAGPSRSSR